jgi:hypothetical protein
MSGVVQGVLAAVAAGLRVEVHGTNAAWADGEKTFTQYRTELSLFGTAWSVDTRWSHLEAVEKKLAKAYADLEKKVRNKLTFLSSKLTFLSSKQTFLSSGTQQPPTFITHSPYKNVW